MATSAIPTNVVVKTFLDTFLGGAQKRALLSLLRGEERQYFRDKIIELSALTDAMPATYTTGGVKDPIVHLHYFVGDADWYIIEKDVDHDGVGQRQAFGLADLFRDGGEMGYISIPEITSCGAELDFYFTPRPLSVVRNSKED